MKTIGIITSLIMLLGMASPEFAFAYIGPGAGFAFLSSFVFAFGAAAAAVLLILTLPLRLLFKSFHLKKRHGPAAVDRLIILGLDGFDPELAGEFMDRGELPELAGLKEKGRFAPLRITNPPISPVSWSSFRPGSTRASTTSSTSSGGTPAPTCRPSPRRRLHPTRAACVIPARKPG